jgi:hypothetical protein
MAATKGSGSRRSSGTGKGKASARSNAAERSNNIPKVGGRAPRAIGGENQRSQGRFPGETPLTGEDRPANRSGGKKRGQRTAGR